MKAHYCAVCGKPLRTKFIRKYSGGGKGVRPRYCYGCYKKHELNEKGIR